MLTKITVRNFKLFEEVEIPLGNGFVFVAPNNRGKTTALQALALWHIGLQKYAEKHGDKINRDSARPGVTVNRLDLIPVPVAELDLIWLNRKIRRGNVNIRIEIAVEGFSDGASWTCGLEFDYANPDAFYCRPLRTGDGDNPKRMEIPAQALAVKLAFLPPMSGLASEEPEIKEGRINVLIGQGQTAEVLRNLCYRVFTKSPANWNALVARIRELFGVTLREPLQHQTRGTVALHYLAEDGTTELDLPSCGRGMQQVLLLLAYLYDNAANTVFLLDEPDAHLEVLRQRQIYDLVNDVAAKQGGQIISASHSEELLNAAAARDAVVAFIGKPHRLGAGKKSNVLAALQKIGFHDYYEAERKNWVLYLEGDTDLRILQAFAARLKHRAANFLQTPFVKYVGNQPDDARAHFHALKEAKEDLRGFLLLDRTTKSLRDSAGLREYAWRKYETENYLCNRDAIMAFITDGLADDIFGRHQIDTRQEKMRLEIEKLQNAFATLNKQGPFSDDIKVSDDFLAPLFANFAEACGLPENMALRKKDFYKLVRHLDPAAIDPEVGRVLEKIAAVAETAEAAAAERD